MSLRGVVRRAAGSLIHRLWAAIRAAGTVSPASPAGYRFRRLGEGACLSFPVGAVFGEAWIEIGDHTLVGERVSISAGMGPGVDLGPNSIVRIGGSCSIGRGSHIVGHQSIDIGDHVFTGPYVYITDQNHVYDDPEMPIGRQWPRNNPVSIGSGSWLGTGAIILPGTRIGRQCVVAGGAVVRGEFPDHSVIAGIPAKVVRHYVPGEGWLPPHLGGAEPPAPETPHRPETSGGPETPDGPETSGGPEGEAAEPTGALAGPAVPPSPA
ncbi:DapH/DapD/GlmU-related protein [Streptosporangium amethystogenes subsp. fukuiense]|uniref:DapH/DapD/GlmU-related protein n=1 Tax=Streptosporangium amethystogenes subsp. fukuiense TaxID=698418 RepID=A0ABW2T012_9ACTN